MSGSDFAKSEVFFKSLSESFALGPGLVEISIVQYSGTATELGADNCDGLSDSPFCAAAILNKFIVQPLSGDINQVCASLGQPQIGQGTPIIQGLQVASCALRESKKSAKYLVFLTDGEPSENGGTPETIGDLTTALKAEGVTIFSIKVGASDSELMKAIATDSSYYYHETDFDQLASNVNFTKRFVDQLECFPPNEPRCECWFRWDLLGCPLVRASLDYECGGGYGSYDYTCDDEEKGTETGLYVLFNILPFVYKFCFVMALRVLLGCQTIDLGQRDFLCWQFCKTSHLMLWAINLFLLFMCFILRCWDIPFYVFYVIFLHIDMIMCIADRIMNVKRMAPPPVAPPRSNLELFAYTNHKKSWKDKAYNTVELAGAKKTISKLAGSKKKFEKAQVARKESIAKKGFSMKGSGFI